MDNNPVALNDVLGLSTEGGDEPTKGDGGNGDGGKQQDYTTNTGGSDSWDKYGYKPKPGGNNEQKKKGDGAFWDAAGKVLNAVVDIAATMSGIGSEQLNKASDKLYQRDDDEKKIETVYGLKRKKVQGVVIGRIDNSRKGKKRKIDADQSGGVFTIVWGRKEKHRWERAEQIMARQNLLLGNVVTFTMQVANNPNVRYRVDGPHTSDQWDNAGNRINVIPALINGQINPFAIFWDGTTIDGGNIIRTITFYFTILQNSVGFSRFAGLNQNQISVPVEIYKEVRVPYWSRFKFLRIVRIAPTVNED